MDCDTRRGLALRKLQSPHWLEWVWHAGGEHVESKSLPWHSLCWSDTVTLEGCAVPEQGLVLKRLDGAQRMLCATVFQRIFARPYCTSSQETSSEHRCVKIKMQPAGPSAWLTVYLSQYCSLENLLSLSWRRQLQERGLNIYGTLKHRKITAYITICILFQGSRTQNCNRVWHILCGNEY